MLEMMFLLLPVAASYGWYMGQKNALQKQNYPTKKINGYFSSLNYLLSHQQEHIEQALDTLNIKEDTLDIHFALGDLFRDRGELNKAIRIHQNITSLAHTHTIQHHKAMMALAKDYIASGFYDRSESLLLELIELADKTDEDREELNPEYHLLRCYQTTQEWDKGIKSFYDFSSPLQKKYNHIIAHFYCEKYLLEDEIHSKKRYLNLSIKHDKSCIRAWCYYVDVYIEEQNYIKLRQATYSILRQNPAFFVEVLPQIKTYYHTSNKLSEYEALLVRATKSGTGNTIYCELAEHWFNHQKVQQANHLIMEQLKSSPSLKAFTQLITHHVHTAEQSNAKESLIILRHIVHSYLEKQSLYQCATCDFQTSRFYWLCPSCHEWTSIQRSSGLIGE
tara:strand:+ start:152 stop:1324 length:1173 start_codon:yes stop_codon:yes gene_type:complete